jgi:hypothetical protein
MPTNFLEYSGGTNGWLTSPVAFMSTEMNTLGNGSAATASVAGPWTQSSLGSGQICMAFFEWTTTFTPTAGGNLSCWWAQSPDGGTNYETVLATPSTTVPALGRPPDFIIPLYEGGAALGATAGTLVKFAMAPFLYPWVKTKLIVQNNSGVSLPASGNQILIGSVANQY